MLIHRARARAAWIATCAARAYRAAGLLFAAYGKTGELLTEPLALAFGAGGLLVSQDNRFKAVLALLADIFEDWHMQARLKWLQHYYYSRACICQSSNI